MNSMEIYELERRVSQLEREKQDKAGVGCACLPTILVLTAVVVYLCERTDFLAWANAWFR